MNCSTRDDWAEALGALGESVSRLLDLTADGLTSPELITTLGELEVQCRRIPVASNVLINQLAAQATAAELGGTLGQALADRLRIVKNDADRRIADAAELGPRRALTGEPLPPLLPATAAAQRRGLVGAGHVKQIRTFFKKLPNTVDAADRDQAEADLAGKAAAGYRPDELADYAKLLHNYLVPDGDFADEQRARSRGITLGAQQPDGMSQIRGLITPELRATLEPVVAKLGAPGMCNPDDEHPVTDGKAPADAVDRDTRTHAQRTHDALNTGLRTLLESTTLGRHHGLPTTIVVTTTLAELEAGAGRALTAGGTLLPMSDVLRLASPAHHYLAIFDKDKTLALYHGKRLASPEQRLTLLARDRGCTRPGCTVPGYWTQVHHLEGWINTRRTHIDELALACPPDNRLVELHKYTTRRNIHGIAEWIPPKHLDFGRPRVNCLHHPGKHLGAGNDGEGG
ncbi:HNH endonuclease signature motif containing protein [Mycobacterium sp. TY815]|uniref:HNH endonuclease signature motif containing protein n=1 Tax=Mycobacterium sp. TY815 TaxID=3050581 RepID=UPI002740D4C5|nr:HNH endonuclease signature motif containing protein [Mycobacterium sp. TY815]MDP7705797.1 HNH endonuclease signature motif containing protein [Mycobacterium sp. TY815]